MPWETDQRVTSPFHDAGSFPFTLIPRPLGVREPTPGTGMVNEIWRSCLPGPSPGLGDDPIGVGQTCQSNGMVSREGKGSVALQSAYNDGPLVEGLIRLT